MAALPGCGYGLARQALGAHRIFISHKDVGVIIVPAKALLYDISKIDFNNVVADIDAIRRVNPQRYEMEQLTAVVYESLEEHGLHWL